VRKSIGIEVAFMLRAGSKFYLSKLTDGEKNLYNHISGALGRFEPALSLHAGMGKDFTVDIQKVLTYALLDQPGLFYLNKDCVIIKQTPMYIQLCFEYDYLQAETERLSGEIKEKIVEFMCEYIEPKMTPLAKQLAVHKYLQSVVTPQQADIDRDSHSVIGALLRRSCVCEGFAKAHKLLCDYLRIASIVVSGHAKGEAHAWNITRINGVTAHTDVTWDTGLGIGSYDYFNLCDADMAADHSFDADLYPKCAPNKINYFYKNGLIASNEAEVRRIISENTDKDFFSVKCLFPLAQEQLGGLGFPAGKLRYNDAQNIVMFMRE
jgi:hypothetical protein